MKTERLLEIVIHLLNHESATARQLADKLGVSVRTIQRDMDCISASGVPLVSFPGSSGGYAVAPEYRIRNQFVKKEDFDLIVLALKSLNTGYDNARLESVLDRYLSLRQGSPQNVLIDYGVTKEDAGVQARMKTIEKGIGDCVLVEFGYRNAEGARSRKRVAPLALRFKWYAWYLFAYDAGKKGYRTYKLARMSDVALTGHAFQPPGDVEALIHESEREYLKGCENIEVLCRGGCIPVLEEYFPEEAKELLPDGSCLMHLHVPAGERQWQALLLSMGDGVKILSPGYYRDNLIRLASGFLSNQL